MLDVISGGRLEFGIGRGYQPREAEVFGPPYGATIQDQERNRAYYHEAYEIIMKAWTQPSFSHHGEFFSIPPSYTKWHHKGTMAYFSMPKAGRHLEDVLAVGQPDLYSMGSPIMAATTTLKEISVFPQPVQKPHPQVWEPVTSERSIRWAAQHKVNAFTVPEPTSRLRRNIEIYYEEAQKQGWPDRRSAGHGGTAGTLSNTGALAAAAMCIFCQMAASSRHYSVTKRPGVAVGLLRPVWLCGGAVGPWRADVRHADEGHGRSAHAKRDCHCGHRRAGH